MKLTTGYEFQGYFITEYYDVIFDEMLVGIGMIKSLLSSFDNFASALTGSEATVIVDKLNAAKKELRERVIQEASRLGANALIGIDFESSKLGDIIMVSMTATAVHIEKIVSDLPFTEADQKAVENKRIQEEFRLKREAQKASLEEMMRTNGVDPNVVIDLISQLKDAREMKSAILELSKKNPGLFSTDFLKSVDQSVVLGRIYGNSLGAEDIIKKLKTYLTEHT